MEIKREHHINFWYIILAFIAILFIQEPACHSQGLRQSHTANFNRY